MNIQSDEASPKEVRTIEVLPKDVVDRIAAGEVVQRPASAIKELLENSLDAKSTHIIVEVDRGSCCCTMSISDNGCGMSPRDLMVAAKRFATSKLRKAGDLDSIASFGFRGEALASMSMVSHLQITSRTASTRTAFRLSYNSGAPISKAGKKDVEPTVCARSIGTTVLLEDLFYNVPHRRAANLKRMADEYQRVLSVVQHYAIHYASEGVSFCCQSKSSTKKKKTSGLATVVDLNTANLKALKSLQAAKQELRTESIQDDATKQVICNVFGSTLESSLVRFFCQKELTDDSTSMSYSCKGYFTSPLIQGDKSPQQRKTASLSSPQFIVFVNHRSVDIPILKRSFENVYAGYCTQLSKANLKHKPAFVYLSIKVPAHHVDVNVHPTKRQVALQHTDEIMEHIKENLNASLAALGKSFVVTLSQETRTKQSKIHLHEKDALPVVESKDTRSKTSIGSKTDDSGRSDEEYVDSCKVVETTPDPRTSGRLKNIDRKVLSQKKLVRTHQATPVGAIEPFLVRKIPKQSPISPKQNFFPLMEGQVGAPGQSQLEASGKEYPQHRLDCPLNKAIDGKMDLSQPGAFAKILQQCTCRSVKKQPSTSLAVSLPSIRISRPRAIIPTVCHYTSIITLRKRVNKYACKELQKELRESYFVGVASQHRSLIQCQEALCLVNHTEMAKELFYQLALARFGDAPVASVGDHSEDCDTITQSSLHLLTLLEHAILIKEDFQVDNIRPDDSIPMAKTFLGAKSTAHLLARQAVDCLFEHAGMLEEYFAIRLEKRREVSPYPKLDEDPQNDSFTPPSKRTKMEEAVVLTGLPILLEGHIPSPHGLPHFLLRLATEVDWTNEQLCFDGICRELAFYYSHFPDMNDKVSASVRHVLFPAIGYLLVSPKRFLEDGTFQKISMISTLYKMFDR